MEHTTKIRRAPAWSRACTYPLTALGAVSRVYTNLAVLDVTERGFVVVDIVPGLDFAGLQQRTGRHPPSAGLTRRSLFRQLHLDPVAALVFSPGRAPGPPRRAAPRT